MTLSELRRDWGRVIEVTGGKCPLCSGGLVANTPERRFGEQDVMLHAKLQRLYPAGCEVCGGLWCCVNAVAHRDKLDFRAALAWWEKRLGVAVDWKEFPPLFGPALGDLIDAKVSRRFGLAGRSVKRLMVPTEWGWVVSAGGWNFGISRYVSVEDLRAMADFESRADDQGERWIHQAPTEN